MTKTAYIGIFALLLMMFLVNVLFDSTSKSESPDSTASAQAGEPQQNNPIHLVSETQAPEREQNVAEPTPPSPESPDAPPTPPVQVVEHLPEQPVAAYTSYTVRTGDSSWEISVKFYGDGRKWTDIRDANPGLVGSNGELKPGDRLRILNAPVASTRVVRAPEPARPATPVRTPSPTVAGKPYKVKHGDSCWVLAKRFYGDATVWRQIRDANPSTVGKHGELVAGQQIVIPGVE